MWEHVVHPPGNRPEAGRYNYRDALELMACDRNRQIGSFSKCLAQEPQGRLQRLVCQSQRVSYLVKPKMKFCVLSREDGSHLGPREGAGTVGRRSEAREGSSQPSQLPQRTLGLQCQGLVCTVWARVQNQRRWLISQTTPRCFTKKLS